MKNKNRGIATYLSWGSKVVAALFTVYAAIWLPERTGTDIILIAGGIMGPFLRSTYRRLKLFSSRPSLGRGLK